MQSAVCVKLAVCRKAASFIFAYTLSGMETNDTLRNLAQMISSLSAKPSLNALEKDLLRSYLLRMYDALYEAEPAVETGLPSLGETLIPKEKTVPALDEISAVPDEAMEEEEEQMHENQTDLFPAQDEPLKNEPAAEAPEEEGKKESAPQAELPAAESVKPREQEDGMTLNERMAREKNTLADKLMFTPIENIKSHITLNKKVAFIIGLFNQESDDYNRAIDQLNDADNLQDALDTFHGLKNRYGWNAEQDLVRELEALVRRRYSQGS
jgi:hypothetical protein